jgi:imidazolonepropionase-like amidohydrolase
MEFITGAWLFDGRSQARHGGCLVVDDGRIVSVDDSVPDPLPSGSRHAHFENGFVMPGFVDAHNHLELGKGNDELMMAQSLQEIINRSRVNAKADLLCGVTTMRTLGEREYVDVKLGKEIEGGLMPGPRLITGGPWITPSHGHGSYALGADIADGPHEVRVAVRRHIKAGTAWVKLMVSGGIADSGNLSASYYSAEEIRAGVEEAHNHGVGVAVHCYGGPGALMSIEAGVDTIEHGTRITDPRLFDLMAENNVSIVFTTGIVYGDPRLKESTPAAVQAALASGANVAIGADCNHGRFGFEAECAVEYGATAHQALVAMTHGAARACRVADEVGTLEPGKRADVLVVDGNPIDDIRRLRDVLLVMKAGAIVLEADAPSTTAAA